MRIYGRVLTVSLGITHKFQDEMNLGNSFLSMLNYLKNVMDAIKKTLHCDLFLLLLFVYLVSSFNVCSTFPNSLHQRTDQKGHVS